MACLEGRRVLLTGISRGVGFQIARRFLAEGAELIGTARDPERLSRAAQELDPTGKRLTTVAADLSQPTTFPQLAASVEERFGGALDVLCNNAGVQLDGTRKGLFDGTEQVLEQSMAINLWAPYRLTRACLPYLLQGIEPRLINVSSGAGNMESMRSDAIAAYRLSKWALNGLTMLLSRELAGKVSVNAFDPGWVKTDLGGLSAPGSPLESAEGALALLTLPFSETGKFWKDGQEIPF